MHTWQYCIIMYICMWNQYYRIFQRHVWDLLQWKVIRTYESMYGSTLLLSSIHSLMYLDCCTKHDKIQNWFVECATIFLWKIDPSQDLSKCNYILYICNFKQEWEWDLMQCGYLGFQKFPKGNRKWWRGQIFFIEKKRCII